MKNKNLRIELDYNKKEPEFFMHISHESIAEVLLSIAHRRLSHQGSGVIANGGENPIGTRVVQGISFGAYSGADKENGRVYHNSYDEHIEALGLRNKGSDFIVISNGNLGNNPWNIAWQYDQQPNLYCLSSEKEPFAERVYSCFVVPKQGPSKIKDVTFDTSGAIKDADGIDLDFEVDWCSSGQQIVKDNQVVPIESMIEQFSDPRHVFELKDYGKTKEKDIAIMHQLLAGYPRGYREKMLEQLENGLTRGTHYHNLIGTTQQGIAIFESSGILEEVAQRAIGKGITDAIVLDNGGSIGVYTSWLYQNGGFINHGSYFRPQRISTIALVLTSP